MKMKKMSEIKSDGYGNFVSSSESMVIKSSYVNEIESALKSINHADALAENLLAMVNMFERLCEANDFDSDRQPEYVDAKAALATYRGEA